MTREHSPRPGAHWGTRVVSNEQVVPDTIADGHNEPAEPRNRRQRRDANRANRQKGPAPMTDAYLAQVEHQRDQGRRDLRSAENELARLRPLPAQLAAARGELAALHEGEAPTDDDDSVTSAALFLHRWNRATPAERLARAEHVIADWQTARQAPFREERINELKQALDGSFLHHKNVELHQRIEQTEAERDGAYRERAQLTAWLAALHRAVLTPAPDIDEPGWQILYLTVAGQQLSWHIHPRDAELFAHVEQVPADDPRAQWDGHTTAEKYQRIQALTTADQRTGTETSR